MGDPRGWFQAIQIHGIDSKIVIPDGEVRRQFDHLAGFVQGGFIGIRQRADENRIRDAEEGSVDRITMTAAVKSGV